MTVHQFRTADGRSFCFGRNRPTYALEAFANHNVPPIAHYLKATILPPPVLRADCAPPALNKAGLEKILGNDVLGDCVEVGCGNLIDLWHADAGTGISVTAAQTIAFHSAASGYVIGNPATDQGSDEIGVFGQWFKNGFAPDQPPLAGYITVNPANIVAVKTCIWLFGGLLVGAELLSAWVNAMTSRKSGFVWDVGSVPDPNAGHGFAIYGYNAQGVFIVTWGMFGTLTWKALAAVASAAAGGNLLCMLSPDWFTKAGASPSGFDRTALASDLPALAAA